MNEFLDRSYYHMFDTSEGGDTGRQAYTETSKLLGKAVWTSGCGGVGRDRRCAFVSGGDCVPLQSRWLRGNGLPQTAAAILQPKSCPPEAKERCLELGGIVAASVLL